jgi:hypothetical protein
MADAAPEIRTQSVFVLLLAMLIALGLPLAGLMLLVLASKPVGILPREPPIAIAFGAAMSLGFSLVHILLSRRVARSLGYALGPLEVPRASQLVQTMVAADHQRTGAAVQQALRELSSSQPIPDSGGRRFSTTTRTRWSSWGERVEVLNGGGLKNVARVIASVREAVAAGSTDDR